MKLVSCIMPTRGRKELAAQALQCFLAQDYPEKQLVIIDDSEDLSFASNPSRSHPEIVYIQLGGHASIPKKRNLCCEYAQGNILIHWDSDDWSAPTRISDQVARLNHSGKMVTGYHSMLFYNAMRGCAYKYENGRSYAVGTSLAYTRFFWENHKFDEGLTIREDNKFAAQALDCQQLESVDAGPMMVARIHSANTETNYANFVERHTAFPVTVLPPGFPA